MKTRLQQIESKCQRGDTFNFSVHRRTEQVVCIELEVRLKVLRRKNRLYLVKERLPRKYNYFSALYQKSSSGSYNFYTFQKYSSIYFYYFSLLFAARSLFQEQKKISLLCTYFFEKYIQTAEREKKRDFFFFRSKNLKLLLFDRKKLPDLIFSAPSFTYFPLLYLPYRNI